MLIFSLEARELICTRKMILTGYLLLSCKFKQVVRRESQWTDDIEYTSPELGDIHVGKEGQKTCLVSYVYGLSTSTVSGIISDVIGVMYIRMTPFVAWPERADLRKTMSMQFGKYFGNTCAVIIDCFEVFIDRPSNLRARAETGSLYKHHNTVKFLIGITPQGTVSYITN